MKKDVVVLPKAVVSKTAKEANKMIEDCRQLYGAMQQSWFRFAKTLHDIERGQVYKISGEAASFKEFAEKEFPTLNYKTAMKFIAIVDSMGDQIEARFKKDEHYRLPAYESCYQLISMDDTKVPREEISKLKKAVLDGKISYHSLRSALKEYISKYRAQIRSEVDSSVDELEQRLAREIEEDEGEVPEFDDEEEDYESEEPEIDEDEEDDEIIVNDDLATAIMAMKTRVDYIRDNLPSLLERMTEQTEEASELAASLDEASSKMDKFLTKYERLK